MYGLKKYEEVRIIMKKVLVISCHADDVELGCGATVYHLIKGGYDVYSVVFSASDSYPITSGFSKEWHASMSVLGIKESNRFVFNYPARRIFQSRQEVLQHLVDCKKDINPDYIFSPTISNIHQDHEVVGAEAFRAFKDRVLWNYELPWSDTGFKPQVYVPISKEELNTKINALKQYKSQYELCRPYFSKKFLCGMAMMRGIQVGVEFAETFDVQRMVVNF